MKFIAALISIFLISNFQLGCSETKPEAPTKSQGTTYRDLLLKDYEEMLAMVKGYVNKAHKIVGDSDTNTEWEHDAKLEMIKAERLILSRPNSDNMVSKLVVEVKREMGEIGSYDDVLEAITHEGVQAFNGDLNLPVPMQTTFLFVLENLMSELKPEITEDPRQQALMEQIRDAKIKVPYDVMAERKLQAMFLTENPSEEAAKILDDAGLGKKKKRK